jgi:hypothetical protein
MSALIHGGAANYGMTREYSSWAGMRQRCLNPKHKNYKNYGGRGIRVCDRWNSFTAFLSDMGLCPPEQSLDRINNEGNYEPSNCRWATRKQQNRNYRRNIVIKINGKSQCLLEWTNQQNLDYAMVYARIKRLGWNPERALELA